MPPRYIYSVFVFMVCVKPRIMNSHSGGAFSSLSAWWVSQSRGNSSTSRALITIITAAQKTKDQVRCVGSVRLESLIVINTRVF